MYHTKYNRSFVVGLFLRISTISAVSRKYMKEKEGILIVSYVKSLRFKLMLLCVIPLVSLAAVFITHSVFIALQMRDMAGSAYLAAVSDVGAEESILQALREVSVDTGWIARQWAVCFGVTLVCFYIPITINIKKFIMPIRQMSKYSDSLAEGNVQIEVIKNRTDEIGILQESFQKLAFASQQQADLIRKMADGDISGSYTPRSEVDVVGRSLVEMLENNNAAMTQVALAAEQIASASSQIADSSQLLASGATQQSASVAELSDSIKDVAQMTYSNAELVNRATDLGDTIMVHAKNGNRQMEQMVDAVKEISDASLGINKVMKVIDDIAFQTNILALNAAVEAARAGQHGKGFAVVADEVRSLASKSAEAAKDTGSLIANSIEKAQLGTQIASETAASLTEIAAEISESSQIIANVAKSYERQNKAIEQINSGMDQVLQVVHQNSASAEESAAASEEMSAQSKILQGLVSRFKLRAASSDGKSDSPFRSHPQTTFDTAYSLTRAGGEFDKY